MSPQDVPFREAIPPLLDQDVPGYGIWRAVQSLPDYGYMEWTADPLNTTGVYGQLRDQEHESGSWWTGSGQSMTWQPNKPAPNPAPVEQLEETADDGEQTA